ncbi:GDP-mannose 4,6-dehydratase (plasmid) [Halorarum halophilum]|uniref:GDP-mannose 4,6-dehydratase n=1 Tax=Halorarum halophilum TaxID=2743090 RepID=A0A7D5KGQ8_9EURY|nr:GDP-mannose 4,6-dehydratase [Halobaculum halophilum]QLG30017.1 GDP-mannose 4,6-dehydratase [Halobaculum halophilum]
MVHALVTGGAGFIGSHLAGALLERGHEVTILDNLDPYYDVTIKERNLETLESISATTDGELTVIKGSILNEKALGTAMRGADIVYHHAAKAGVGPSVDNPQEYTDVNVQGTLKVLDMARRFPREIRVVNASSSSVYGPADYTPIDEEHPTRPLSPYALTKLTTEHYCRLYTELHNVPTVNLRYFTVYGPRMRTGMAIPDFTARAVDDDATFTCLGDGFQSRDFTYVDDVVQANLAILETDMADGETINIGSGGNVTVAELIEYVQESLFVDKEIEYLPAREGGSRHTHADYEKARRLLGYRPRTNIWKGVDEFVDWYLENIEWYHPLALKEAV